MILLILSRRLSFISESWAVEEEGIQCFDIKTANTNRIKCVSKNLCLNLCSLKWLRVAWRQVRKIVYFGWLMLKTLLLRGLIKFQIFFLKVEYEGELRILGSNLFHSTNADGKKKVKSYSLHYTGKSPSFDYFLFGMNCYLKELSHINILGTAL